MGVEFFFFQFRVLVARRRRKQRHRQRRPPPRDAASLTMSLPSSARRHLLTLPQGIVNIASPPSRGRSGLESSEVFGGAGVI